MIQHFKHITYAFKMNNQFLFQFDSNVNLNYQVGEIFKTHICSSDQIKSNYLFFQTGEKKYKINKIEHSLKLITKESYLSHIDPPTIWITLSELNDN